MTSVYCSLTKPSFTRVYAPYHWPQFIVSRLLLNWGISTIAFIYYIITRGDLFYPIDETFYIYKISENTLERIVGRSCTRRFQKVTESPSLRGIKRGREKEASRIQSAADNVTLRDPKSEYTEAKRNEEKENNNNYYTIAINLSV